MRHGGAALTALVLLLIGSSGDGMVSFARPSGAGPATARTSPGAAGSAPANGVAVVPGGATAGARGGASAEAPAGALCSPDGSPSLARLAGSDRVATAVAVSSRLWDDAGEVVLASAAGYADALAATALAARRQAPLLLTAPKRLPAAVAGELDRLRPARVTVAGGPQAVSAEVAEEVEATAGSPEVVQVAGPDRYGTAAALARATGPSTTGEVALASGQAFPDALAAGALAATPDRIPTLLTLPDRLHPQALSALRDLKASTALLVGGPAAVAPQVADRLEEEGLTVRRLAGGDRYATAARVAGAALERSPTSDGIVLTTGAAFPDALAAAPAAARAGAVPTLAPPRDLRHAPALWELLTEGRGDLVCNAVVGGPATVGVRVAEQVAALLEAPPPDGPTVLVGAGDIAWCRGDGDAATAALLGGITGTVATFGDNAYPSGSPDQFSDCYDPTWGRHRVRTRPAPGNHDYMTAGGAGYFGYFGAAAGESDRGYYSYDLGPYWHAVVLNSNCWAVGGCQAGSPQERWLRADLKANADEHVVAYLHHPRFSTGPHGGSQSIAGLVRALYDHGAELLLAGHDHTYERFAPMDPAGNPEPQRGIRHFVVGTGGRSHYSFPGPPLSTTEVRNGETFGVLALTLARDRYSWEFVPVAGGDFRDSGSHPAG